VELPAPALPRFEPAAGWRKAALIAGVIAAVELVALVVVALAFIAKPFAGDAPAQANAKGKTSAAASAEQTATATVQAQAPAAQQDPPAVAQLPRTKTRVLVLNGNGYVGAASQKAAVVRSFRYPVAGVADAVRRDFPRTIVMFRPGFRGEAERLAKDLGMPRSRAVPLDGMKPTDLSGSQLVLIVGNEP
jgi:hypothetical protein